VSKKSVMFYLNRPLNDSTKYFANFVNKRKFLCKNLLFVILFSLNIILEERKQSLFYFKVNIRTRTGSRA